MSIRLAIIGDVHGCWTAADNDYFNAGHYDAVIFVGDLPPLIGSLPTARKLAGLRVPAYMIPGNHDATGALQFLAELRHKTGLANFLSLGHARRESKLRKALGGVKLLGYSLELLSLDGRTLGLLAARPYSMGGDRMYFSAYLKRRHGVGSFEESVLKLKALVDSAPNEIIFLSHNGPSGLGSARDDIWGCDFRESGDFGDPDLRMAIDYALSQGKRVHAVVAGHMHHRRKDGGFRRHWQLSRDGVLNINAARVPRIRYKVDGQPRHHVALTLDDTGARAEALWINSDNEPCAEPISPAPRSR